jgi:hypothetical protein
MAKGSRDVVGCSWHFAGETLGVVKLFELY